MFVGRPPGLRLLALTASPVPEVVDVLSKRAKVARSITRLSAVALHWQLTHKTFHRIVRVSRHLRKCYGNKAFSVKCKRIKMWRLGISDLGSKGVRFAQNETNL